MDYAFNIRIVMPTNTRESGLESLIVNWLVEQNCYEQGTSADYNRDYAVDELRLFRFLKSTQPEQIAKLDIHDNDLKRTQFLDRLRGEIAKRGIIDVLRNGIKAYPANLIMFYMTPWKKIQKQKNFLIKIYSALRGNYSIQTITQNWHLIYAYLSTVYL
jgi:type I restriction enzyme R subunit